MPIDIACPDCATKYRIPDSAAGKKVKCKSCSTTFPIPEADVEEVDPWEVDDDDNSADEEYDAPPPKRKKPSSGRLPAPAAKKVKSSSGGSRKTYDSDEDDDEERPKKRKKKRKKSSGASPVLIWGGLTVLSLISVVLVGIYFPMVMFWGGLLAMFAGGIWTTIVAYEEDSWCGFAVMRIPGYSIYYTITRIGELWPALTLQTVGLIAVIAGLVLHHRKDFNDIVAAVRNPGDPFAEAALDAEPEERRFLVAAGPFLKAVAKRDYRSAHAELSRQAVTITRANQFFPDEQEPPPGSVAQPIENLGADQFAEWMGKMEQRLSVPRAVNYLYVDTTDPGLLSGKGDPLEVALTVGAVPAEIAPESRKAVVRADIRCEFDAATAKEIAEKLKITEEQVQSGEWPENDEFFYEAPYLNVKLLIVEEEGNLKVGYFEIQPPSILD